MVHNNNVVSFYNVAFCIIFWIQNGDNTVIITNAITKSKIVNTKNPNNVFRKREYYELDKNNVFN